MSTIIITLSVVALSLLIWLTFYLLKGPNKPRTSSQHGNILDNGALFVLPRPPEATARVEAKIDWVIKCAATLDMVLGSISEGRDLITKESVKSTSDNIRLLAYHYEELASLGGIKESMYEHGKKEIQFSRGNKTGKAFLTYLWEFFCCGYDLIYKDKEFRAWTKREDIPKSNSLILLRILLLILLNSFEADQ
jgi:hypothetical protein